MAFDLYALIFRPLLNFVPLVHHLLRGTKIWNLSSNKKMSENQIKSWKMNFQKKIDFKVIFKGNNILEPSATKAILRMSNFLSNLTEVHFFLMLNFRFKHCFRKYCCNRWQNSIFYRKFVILCSKEYYLTTVYSFFDQYKIVSYVDFKA